MHIDKTEFLVISANFLMNKSYRNRGLRINSELFQTHHLASNHSVMFGLSAYSIISFLYNYSYQDDASEPPMIYDFIAGFKEVKIGTKHRLIPYRTDVIQNNIL